MLDLTKPLRHKETKAEARVVFTDLAASADKYLVVVRWDPMALSSTWVGLQKGGEINGSPQWLTFWDLCNFLENVPTKITGEVWVNVHRDGKTTCWRSREEADKYTWPHRIARVKLPFTAEEGQFDE